MDPTNVKIGEYVSVYHDSKEDSFYFNTIPVEEYDTVKQDASANKNLLHRMLSRANRNSSPDIVAAFFISPNGFTATIGNYGQDDKTGTHLNSTIFYVSGIMILSEFNSVIYDVLYDFIAINGMERGAEVIRVEVDLKASNGLNADLASRLANDEDTDYRLVDFDGKFAYFEAKLSDFEE